jgi:hypothetical protein
MYDKLTTKQVQQVIAQNPQIGINRKLELVAIDLRDLTNFINDIGEHTYYDLLHNHPEFISYLVGYEEMKKNHSEAFNH